MPPKGYAPIARVIKPHGLNGEVAVVVYDDLDLAAFLGEQVWVVPPPASVRVARIGGVRPGPKGPLVALEGVSSIDDADRLRGAELLVDADLLPDDASDAAFDPVGLRLVDETRGDIGRVTDLIITGANDVWVVDGPLGEVLVPVIDDVVLEVDGESRTARVRLLPGLVDGEGS